MKSIYLFFIGKTELYSSPEYTNVRSPDVITTDVHCLYERFAGGALNYYQSECS